MNRHAYILFCHVRTSTKHLFEINTLKYFESMFTASSSNARDNMVVFGLKQKTNKQKLWTPSPIFVIYKMKAFAGENSQL